MTVCTECLRKAFELGKFQAQGTDACCNSERSPSRQPPPRPCHCPLWMQLSQGRLAQPARALQPQRCPDRGAGCSGSADTLIFLLAWNQNWLFVWSAFQLGFAMTMNYLRPSLANGPRGKAGADCNMRDRWYLITSWEACEQPWRH